AHDSVPSSEASSTMISSSASTCCARTLRMACLSNVRRFRVGMTTLTKGTVRRRSAPFIIFNASSFNQGFNLLVPERALYPNWSISPRMANSLTARRAIVNHKPSKGLPVHEVPPTLRQTDLSPHFVDPRHERQRRNAAEYTACILQLDRSLAFDHLGGQEQVPSTAVSHAEVEECP